MSTSAPVEMSSKYFSLPPTITGPRTTSSKLVVKNSSSVPLRLLWRSFEGDAKCYATIQPGECNVQSDTYSTHTWVVEDEEGKIWAYHNGPTSLLNVEGVGISTVAPLKCPGTCCDYQWDQHSTRATAAGLAIKAHPCVSSRAIDAVTEIVEGMLSTANANILRRMRRNRASISIIGQYQETGDVPAFWTHRYSTNKKRGFGGVKRQPTCCCAEEDVLSLDSNPHFEESVLIHELAHTVMNLGFDDALMAEEDRIFQQARASGKYDSTSYMMENNEEFWAEASQAWFEATLREDVTSGLRTKQQVLDREPELAQLMIKVYGDTDWLYSTSAVRQLVCKKGGHLPSLRVQKVPVAKIKEQLGPSMTRGVAQRRRRFIGKFFTCFAA